MERLRAALIGAGGRGKSHANALANAPHVDFVAVCDMDETVGRETAEQYGIDYVPNTTELYARDDIAGVGICVQTPAHHKLAMEAVGAGRHLLTEKPMAASFTQAREMLDAVRESGLRAALSYQLRFAPLFAKARELCAVIEPLQIIFARQRGMLTPKYLSPAPFDGIMDFISHDIDMIPFLAGRTPTAVSAVLRRDTWSDTGAIDVVSAQIEFAGEGGPCFGHISSSMGGQGIPQRLDIVGRKGFVFSEGNTVHFTTEDNPPGPLDPRDRWALSFEGQVRDSTIDLYDHWATAALDPEASLAPAATYEDGYNALLITLAIVESGRSGERIQLADFAESLT